ncbi:allantoicase [Hahella sp. CCB-MM4]|uniref:allantoicase n=1 Tax=Hahella sp. (strain CCB-MM4) TaxID=1926491 RepID=UPI000B9C5B68|nr:allantoicase [Hahella sp. CCB-MM4]OZG70261.1 allantoicase [Hahella sp. CCB-MM4]
MANKIEYNRFSSRFTDLASSRLGGQALSCSDDFFAEMENLLSPKPAVFIEDKYTHRGKWMDGWESRRRRDSGYDWCVIKLGMPGVIRGLDVDTSFFLGNAPKSVSVEACRLQQDPDENTQWMEILPRTEVEPGSHNLLDVSDDATWTHIRLNIFPDGGVARLKVYGEVTPDWDWYLPGEPIDLAAIVNGGRPLLCSDMFFSPMENLLMPGRGKDMGDGWETKRRRGGRDCDWLVLKLGDLGRIAKVEVDTAHFKGNYPASFSLEAVRLEADVEVSETNVDQLNWMPVIDRIPLSADRQHRFMNEIQNSAEVVSHVRLKIFPDGGVSRLRVWCLRG